MIVRRVIRPALIAAVVVLTTTGCAQIRGEREFTFEDGRTASVASVESSADDRPVEPAATVQIEVDAAASVPAAFAFDAVTVAGAPTTGIDLLGDRGTIITFVQPTCPFSTDEAPKIAAAARRHPDLRFVVAFSGGDTGAYAAMLADAGLHLPNVVAVDDTSATLWNRFAITASPSSVLVDADLHLRSSYGALGDDGLDRAVAAVTGGFDPAT